MLKLGIRHTVNCRGFTCDYDRDYSVPAKLCSYPQGFLSAKFKLLKFSRKVLQRKMKMEIHVDNRPIITLIRHVDIKKPT